MGKPVRRLEQSPEPGEAARAAAARTDAREIAPQAEPDQRRIGDQEADRAVEAERFADRAGGREHVVQAGQILLGRMRGLGGDQQRKQDSAPPVHAQCRAVIWPATAVAAPPSGWVSTAGGRPALETPPKN